MEELIKELEKLQKYDMSANIHGMVDSFKEENGSYICVTDLEELIKKYKIEK